MGLVLLAACTRASAPSDGRGEATAGEGKAEERAGGVLELVLPAWVAVSIDDETHGAAESIEVGAGSHTLLLQTVCGETSHRVDVVAGQTTRVRMGDVRDLPFTSLQLDVRDRSGKRLDATLTLDAAYGMQVAKGDGWQTAIPDETSAIEVPACPLRMTVRSAQDDDLGAFIEDLQLNEREVTRRRIVLQPGPDLVRIHGGSFVAGQTPGYLEGYGGKWTNTPHDVKTFDIDRHEVTVAQFEACVRAGGCDENVEHGRTRFLPEALAEACNANWELTADRRRLAHVAKTGREDHPIDCLAMWEAERYCAWAGKRLPTTVEWEFAARSRKTEYKWPWGNDESLCRAHTESRHWEPPLCPERASTTTVCSYPLGNSEQGVCDLVGNVSEMLDYPYGHRYRDVGVSVRGGGYGKAAEPFQDVWIRLLEELDTERHRQEVGVGFRCARDVEGRVHD